jgi:spore coat polysaccharide biosynthesis protein SpsF
VKTVAITQARTSSTRLPRKVLLDLEGQPLLAWHLRRVARARRLDELVVATSTDPSDDEIVALATSLGFRCWRGPLDDVLGRFAGAARFAEATTVVRVVSDSPFLDPELIDATLAAWPRPGVDYLAPHGLPMGLGHEVMTVEALRRADAEAALPHERAHVTPHIYLSPGKFRCDGLAGPGLHDLRWCVDTAEDLAFVREVARRLGPGDGFGWREILALVQREPALAALNAHVRQKTMEEC